MTAEPDPSRGRLLVVTGGPVDVRAALAGALAATFQRAVVIDVAVFDAMVVSGRTSPAAPPGLDALRLSMLRWSAAIATAETFQLEGYDAVVTDDLLGDRLEDFLDLAAPEPVHVVVLDDGRPATSTPRWGLWVGCPTGSTGQPAVVDPLVAEVLSRLDESIVPTAPTG